MPEIRRRRNNDLSKRVKNAPTDVTAFGLYVLAGILLLPALFATPGYPRSLLWLGTAEWTIAAVATALLILAPAIAMVLLLVSSALFAPWAWESAYWLPKDRPPRR